MRRSSHPISWPSRRGSMFERSTRFGCRRRSWPIELIVVSRGPKRLLNVICCSSVSRWSWKTSTEYSWNASKIRWNVTSSSGPARSTPSTRAPRHGWMGVTVTPLTVSAMPRLLFERRLHRVRAAALPPQPILGGGWGGGRSPPPRILAERFPQLAREDHDRAARAAAAELLDGFEEVHDLLGERRLTHAPAPGAEHLDLAVEWRGLVLVERADHVVGERLVRVRVELAAREADDVRRVQARVLGVDGHEQLDDLARVERVEENGG